MTGSGLKSLNGGQMNIFGINDVPANKQRIETNISMNTMWLATAWSTYKMDVLDQSIVYEFIPAEG